MNDDLKGRALVGFAIMAVGIIGLIFALWITGNVDCARV